MIRLCCHHLMIRILLSPFDDDDCVVSIWLSGFCCPHSIIMVVLCFHSMIMIMLCLCYDYDSKGDFSSQVSDRDCDVSVQ